MEKKDFVTKQGLFTSIVVTVIGIGAFSYPSEMSKQVGSDAWIISILSGVISWILLTIFYVVIKKNNYDKFHDILKNNLGAVFSKLAVLAFSVFNILAVALGMRMFSEVIKMYLLERTPTEFILAVLILSGTYLVRGEIRSLVRFNEITFWIMFLPVILILILASKNADFTNVLPLLTHEPPKYLYAMIGAIYSFSGYHIAYLIIPHCKYKKDIGKTIITSMVFITLFYTVITVFCLAILNKNMTATLLWPTINMIRTIDIPGTFIERWDGVAMAFWVLFYFTTFTNSYYFSAETIKDSFYLGDVKISSLIIIPFIYITALYPENIGELYDIASKYIPILFLLCIIIIPLTLLILSSLKKGRCTKNET